MLVPLAVIVTLPLAAAFLVVRWRSRVVVVVAVSLRTRPGARWGLTSTAPFKPLGYAVPGFLFALGGLVKGARRVLFISDMHGLV